MRIFTVTIAEEFDGVGSSTFHVDAAPDGTPALIARALAALRLKALSLGLRESHTSIVPDPPAPCADCGNRTDYEFGLRCQLEAAHKENERLTAELAAVKDTVPPITCFDLIIYGAQSPDQNRGHGPLANNVFVQAVDTDGNKLLYSYRNVGLGEFGK